MSSGEIQASVFMFKPAAPCLPAVSLIHASGSLPALMVYRPDLLEPWSHTEGVENQDGTAQLAQDAAEEAIAAMVSGIGRLSARYQPPGPGQPSSHPPPAPLGVNVWAATDGRCRSKSGPPSSAESSDAPLSSDQEAARAANQTLAPAPGMAPVVPAATAAQGTAPVAKAATAPQGLAPVAPAATAPQWTVPVATEATAPQGLAPVPRPSPGPPPQLPDESARPPPGQPPQPVHSPDLWADWLPPQSRPQPVHGPGSWSLQVHPPAQQIVAASVATSLGASSQAPNLAVGRPHFPRAEHAEEPMQRIARMLPCIQDGFFNGEDGWNGPFLPWMSRLTCWQNGGSCIAHAGGNGGPYCNGCMMWQPKRFSSCKLCFWCALATNRVGLESICRCPQARKVAMNSLPVILAKGREHKYPEVWHWIGGASFEHLSADLPACVPPPGVQLLAPAAGPAPVVTPPPPVGRAPVLQPVAAPQVWAAPQADAGGMQEPLGMTVPRPGVQSEVSNVDAQAARGRPSGPLAVVYDTVQYSTVQ